MAKITEKKIMLRISIPPNIIAMGRRIPRKERERKTKAARKRMRKPSLINP